MGDFITNHNEKGYRKIFDDYQSIRSLFAHKNDQDVESEPDFESIQQQWRSTVKHNSIVTNEIEE
jgi:hypothetical protein